MVQTVLATAFVASLPTMAWWYWWRATYRRPQGAQLEKLRTSAGMSLFLVPMFLLIAVMQGLTAVNEGDDAGWWAAGILVAAVVVSVPAMLLTRRLLGDSRPGPSPDLERRLTSMKRWTLPVSVGLAALSGLTLVGTEITLLAVLVGPVMLGVFLFVVLTGMRVAVERSVRLRG